jgi:hypothetical protein
MDFPTFLTKWSWIVEAPAETTAHRWLSKPVEIECRERESNPHEVVLGGF